MQLATLASLITLPKLPKLPTLQQFVVALPGVEYRKGKFAFAANGRSIANMDTDGFVKAWCAGVVRVQGSDLGDLRVALKLSTH